MRIALINPRLKVWSPNIYVPLGLAYIAAVLEREGYNVEIIDLNVERINDEGFQRKIENIDIIGITGMITEYAEVLRLVDIVKKANGETKVILGGPLATMLPQEILQVSQADFVVVGEGERTIGSLISAIKHGDGYTDIKGIAYRDGNQIVITKPADSIASLDTIPFPARHLLDMKRYLRNYFEGFGFKIKGSSKIKSTSLITSRGCPYSCTFCFKDMWGHKWRARSPQNIVEEMEFLYGKYGVNGFLFTDDTFSLDRKRIFELCKLLKEGALDVAWYCNGRVNLMTKELLEAMYNAGCIGIAYGIESGNQQILDSMKKSITLEQVRNAVKWTKEAGIYVTGYFMIGMLGETRDTIRQTITFARELALDHYAFSIAAPIPGTELYDGAMERGLMKEDIRPFKELLFSVNTNLTQDCSDDDLLRFQSEAFREFTLEKFGKYYAVNPTFLRQMAKVVLSLQSKNEAKELGRKIWWAIQSYWHRT